MLSAIKPNATEGIVRTTDTGGLAPALLDAIAASGGLWYASDLDTGPSAILAFAREHRIRALRLDFRDIAFLRELPELEFLHLRSDGRPPLEAVADLPNLRALIIETGALRGTISLAAHPNLEWLHMKLSGRGGRENIPHILGGHAGVRDLRLDEVPFTDLTALARAFPGARHVRIYGGNRLRALGDLGPWRKTLQGISTVWVPVRSVEELVEMGALRFVGMTFAKLRSIAAFRGMEKLAYLSLLGSVPSLGELAGHPGLRIVRLSRPADGDFGVLRNMPALVGLIGRKWIQAEIGVPFLEDLPEESPLVREWSAATQLLK